MSDAGTGIDPVTPLPATMELAWQDLFGLGFGVDIATREVRITPAIEFDPPQQRDTFADEMTFGFVSDETTFNREIDIAAKGSGLVEGVTISVSADYTSKIEYSATSMTLVARYTGTYTGPDRIGSPRLTAAAKKVAHDPEEFRSLYGDYFVNGVKRGFHFHALYVLRASSEQSLNDFKGTFGASAPEIFDAEVSGKFLQTAAKSGVDVSVQIVQSDHRQGPDEPVGDEKGTYTPASVLPALKWFKANKTAVNLVAELVHYSELIKDYDPVLFVPSDFLGNVQALDRALLRLGRVFGTARAATKDSFQDAFDRLNLRIETDRLTFAAHPDRVMPLVDACADLQGRIASAEEIVAFVKRLRAAQRNGQVQTFATTVTDLMFPKGLSVKVDTLPCTHTYAVGDTTTTRQCQWSDPTRLLVGMEIASNWTSHNGSAQVPNDALLSNSATVEVTSEFARGFDWTCSFYSVPAEQLAAALSESA